MAQSKTGAGPVLGAFTKVDRYQNHIKNVGQPAVVNICRQVGTTQAEAGPNGNCIGNIHPIIVVDISTQ